MQLRQVSLSAQEMNLGHTAVVGRREPVPVASVQLKTGLASFAIGWEQSLQMLDGTKLGLGRTEVAGKAAGSCWLLGRGFRSAG